jgi:hypothetical protein
MSQNGVNAFGFENVVIGRDDVNGREIVDVYRRQSGRYAIYQTEARVIVMYADDPLVQRIQRKRLTKVATLRSEIDGQLAPWRCKSRKWSRLYQTAREFDMRVASALEEALEGNIVGGLAIMEAVRTDVGHEMASRARLSYLAWTLISAVVILVGTFVLQAVLDGNFASSKPITREMAGALMVPAAIRAGVFGAIYSVALGIHRRDLKRDLRRYDYFTDSFVRIGIGALAAFVLSCFLLSGALRIEFGAGLDAVTNTTDTIDPLRGGTEGGGIYLPTWPVWMIFGFLAGFAERLVPDLLSSYAVKGREAEPAPPVRVDAATAEPNGAAAAVDEDPLPASEEEVIAQPTAEDEVDGCDVTMEDKVTVTEDEHLPPASGGVAMR